MYIGYFSGLSVDPVILPHKESLKKIIIILGFFLIIFFFYLVFLLCSGEVVHWDMVLYTGWQ